jgi:hypothetical protein
VRSSAVELLLVVAAAARSGPLEQRRGSRGCRVAR